MNIITKHRITNKSIEKIDTNRLLGGETAMIFYSDPHWSDGNLKYWNTMRNKMCGTTDEKVVTLEDMTKAIKNLINNHVDGYVILETGIKALDFQQDLLQSIVKNIKVYDVFYKSGSKWKPNKILVGVTDKKYKFDIDLSGIKCDGFKLPDVIFEHIAKKDDLVIDPFMGLGNTGMACVKHDLKFAGNEFNEVRYNRAINNLNKSIKKYART